MGIITELQAQLTAVAAALGDDVETSATQGTAGSPSRAGTAPPPRCGLHPVPDWMGEQQRCESGTLPCRLDTAGNPLDVGREQRLFTPRQRIALAVRDGGCRWRGCDRPASYCEAHHIDPYSEGGRTDIDRGILLCRFHHMQLHNGGWRITRDGRGDFLLHPPGGSSPGLQAPQALRPPLALAYAWAGIDPPPRRFLRESA